MAKIWLSKTTSKLDIETGEMIRISPAMLMVKDGIIKKCATWYLDGVKDGYCVSVTDDYTPKNSDITDYDIKEILLNEVTNVRNIDSSLDWVKRKNFEGEPFTLTRGSFSDNFNDNSLDTDNWVAGNTGNGTATETNQRLEIFTGSAAAAHIVSVDAHNLTGKYFEADIVLEDDVSGLGLFYCLTKVTATGVGGEANFYRSRIDFNGSAYIYTVSNKVSGTPSTLYTEDVSGTETGIQRIYESGGNIYFTHRGNAKYNEAMAISATGYFYLHGFDGTNKTGAFDDFDTDTTGWVVGGWSHNFNGVANASIAKINSVAIANINKVNGVA